MTLAMTPDEIVQELSRRHRKPPMPALQAAIEQRAEVAARLLGELDRLLARLNAITEKAETEQEFLALGSELLSRPSPVFYGFLLAAEWKQKDAYPRFAELLSWSWAGAPDLLSDMVHAELGPAVMAEIYDGDPSPLFDLLLDDSGDEDIRFWQWRTLILLVLRGALDLDALRTFLVRAFDELEQEPESHVWAGWEEFILYFGLEDLTPLVERAHAVQRIRDGTIEEFRRKFAWSLAHPEHPLGLDEVRPFRGLMSEIEWAVETRWPRP
jgi:hypothetical protein